MMKAPKIKIESELYEEMHNELYNRYVRSNTVFESSSNKFNRRDSETLKEWVDRLSYKKRWVDTIYMDRYNRKLRIGFGFNNNRLFFRLDLWSIGFRIGNL